MSTLNFTPGRWYKTRGGQKRYCIGTGLDGTLFMQDARLPSNYYACNPDGTHKFNFKEDDIISEWIDRPEVDWQKYPAWLPWLAMDKDGRWFLYEKEPRTARGEDAWVRDSMGDLLLRVPPEYAPSFSGNWQDSLCSRDGK